MAKGFMQQNTRIYVLFDLDYEINDFVHWKIAKQCNLFEEKPASKLTIRLDAISRYPQ